MTQKRLNLPIILILSILFAGMSRPTNAESPKDIVVFVNKLVPIETISVDKLKQIFLKKKTSWTGGATIVSINAPPQHPVRNRFRSKVLEMTPDEEIRYWEEQKVRRQLSPPPEFTNTPKAVFKLRNAIGYAYRKDVPNGVVKIVAVIP